MDKREKGQTMTDFEAFWARYPRRVSRLAAQKAFQKALKLATLDEILAGVDRYIEHKPEYADYCHPATWLNAGRWMDEYDRRAVPDRRQGERRILSYAPRPHADYDSWPDECRRLHDSMCGNYQAHRLRVAKDAQQGAA